MTHLLDTNAWMNLVQSPENLSPASRAVITKLSSLALSPMSIIEIAQKQSKGRLTLTAPLEEWVKSALFPQISLLPITPEIACDAYRIPDFHGDPADRVIAATARIHQLILITSDKLIIQHTEVKTLSTRT